MALLDHLQLRLADLHGQDEQSREANKRALEVITFVKALVKGDTATVYYRHVGSNRPYTLGMVKEDGKWRIKR